MTCGCCLEACPQFTKDNDFVGAQAIAQALYFNEHDTGKKLKGERLDTLMEPRRRRGLRQRAELRQGLPEGDPADRSHRQGRTSAHDPRREEILHRQVSEISIR